MIGPNSFQLITMSYFPEKKAMALLHKLEQCIIGFVKLSRKIVELSKEM